MLNLNIYLQYRVFGVYMNIKNSEKASGLSQSFKYPHGNGIVLILKWYGNIFIGFIDQLNCLTLF